jgi:hypothetical protein
MLPPYRRLAIERLLLSLAHEATGGTDADTAAIVAATQALHGLHE